MRRTALAACLAPMVLFVACHGEALLVGDQGDAAPDATAGDAGVQPDAGGSPEIWTGYFENYKFPSGSDRITVTLTHGSAGVTGTAFFGDPPEIAPPTDPAIGYPPVDPSWNVRIGFGAADDGPWDRFTFTLVDPSDADSRVTFDVAAYELYKKWCEIETPIYPIHNSNPDSGKPDGPIVGYNCEPNGETSFVNTPNGVCTVDTLDGTGPQPVDCRKLGMCMLPGVCSCTPSACTVDLATSGPHFHFDLHIDGNKASGIVVGLAGANNVFLTRQ